MVARHVLKPESEPRVSARLPQQFGCQMPHRGVDGRFPFEGAGGPAGIAHRLDEDAPGDGADDSGVVRPGPKGAHRLQNGSRMRLDEADEGRVQRNGHKSKTTTASWKARNEDFRYQEPRS